MTAEELVECRNRLGMSQADLANALGKHVQSISRYERGASPISHVMAMAVRSLKPIMQNKDAQHEAE